MPCSPTERPAEGSLALLTAKPVCERRTFSGPLRGEADQVRSLCSSHFRLVAVLTLAASTP